MSSKLLHTPEGVRDLYGEELSLRKRVKHDILKQIHLYGYEDIETPIFEYFDIFGSSIGTTSSKELYKFFDKEGDTLALRPDFTPSIARCAAKYYRDEMIPVRFSYCGEAFINSNSLQGKLCEMTQIGAELIGDDSSVADAEMIHLCAASLRASGLKEFQISIGNSEFLKGLCEAMNLSEEIESTLRDAISIKNFFGASEILRRQGVDENYIHLIENLTSYNTMESVENLMKDSFLSKRSQSALMRIIQILKALDEYGPMDYAAIDLSMVSKYNYYTGMIFKAYTYGVGDAIVKGGRYDKLLSQFDKASPATGFVILLDDLLNALKYAGVRCNKEGAVKLLYKKENAKDALAYCMKVRQEGKKIAMVPYKDEDKAGYIESYEHHNSNCIVFEEL